MPPAPPDDGPDLLREFLRSRHAPCPNCSFDLHGLAEPRCPECGQALSLVIRPTRSPRPGSLGTAVLAAASGGCALVVLTAALQSLSTIPHRPQLVLDLDTEHAYLAAAGLAGFGALLLAWLLPPARLIDRPRPVRAVVVTAAAAGLALLILAFVLLG